MKRMMIMMILTVLGAAAFATGLQESNGQGDGRRWNESTEAVVLTGTLTEIDGHIALDTADGLVSLSAPGYRRMDIELPLGSVVTVTGQSMAANDETCDCGAETHLFVDEALFDGNLVEFADSRGGQGDGNRMGDGSGNRRNSGTRRGNQGGGGQSRNRWDDDDNRQGSRRWDDDDNGQRRGNR